MGDLASQPTFPNASPLLVLFAPSFQPSSSNPLSISVCTRASMAVMCERVTLPPISSLDFALNTSDNENSRAPIQRNRDTSYSPRGYTTPPAPHAPYERSSWDAARPPTSGRPFLTTEHYQDARSRPSAYEYRSSNTFPSPPLPGSLSRRASLEDRPVTADHPLTAPPAFGAPGLADGHQQCVLISFGT